MSTRKIVVDADLLLAHLWGEDHPSVLRRAMGAYFCYTTVFQAIELFAAMHTEAERSAARAAMSAMKILGLNPKNAARYGALFAAHPRRSPLRLLAAGLCIESGLPLLTGRPQEFAGIRGLQLVSPRQLAGTRGARGMDNRTGR